MSDNQNYLEKLRIISAIPKQAIKKPTIPVSIYIHYAEKLYQWMKDDMPEFAAAGFKISLVEDLPARISACRVAQSICVSEPDKIENACKEWLRLAPEAMDLRELLLNTYYYIFRSNDDLLYQLNLIDEDESDIDLMKDLNHLYILGKTNSEELQLINFDLFILEEAAVRSIQLSEILSDANGDNSKEKKAMDIRDQSYTYLKELIDEIKSCGRYLFWKDEKRLTGYTCDLNRNPNQKHSNIFK